VSICFVGSSKKKSGRKRKSTDSAAPSAKKIASNINVVLSFNLIDTFEGKYTVFHRV
jgi:hypothetical protein